jgi:hypothetical protein
MIHKHMSIPEFLNELDLEQLRMVIKMSKAKIEKITDQEKVVVWVFSSGVVNEGFYSTEEDAIQALKDYVNSKEYSVHDTLRIFKVFEYPEEAKRLLED